MDCVLAQRHLDGYVDGELSPSVVFEFEEHLADCAHCQTQVDFARRLKHSLRVQFSAPSAPVGLRESVSAVLSNEGQQGQGDTTGSAERRLRWTAGWGMFASVAAALVFMVSDDSVAWYGAQQAGVAQMPVFGDIVKRHRDHAPTEIETQEPEQVARWVDDNLGLRMETVAFSEPHVRLRGVRLSHVGASRAAKLYYDVGDRRLTAVVFEATPELLGLLEQGSKIRRERVGGREVAYYSVQGYTVPILEHNGLIYGFTGDFERSQLLQLVGSARLP